MPLGRSAHNVCCPRSRVRTHPHFPGLCRGPGSTPAFPALGPAISPGSLGSFPRGIVLNPDPGARALAATEVHSPGQQSLSAHRQAMRGHFLVNLCVSTGIDTQLLRGSSLGRQPSSMPTWAIWLPLQCSSDVPTATARSLAPAIYHVLARILHPRGHARLQRCFPPTLKPSVLFCLVSACHAHGPHLYPIPSYFLVTISEGALRVCGINQYQL